jgi:arylsulfatase A-like enzyme
MDKLPNIIVILSDEHFGGAMSHMGDPNVLTPNMDALAAEGVSFSRAYANCPVCTPSRGTIFSGRHAHSGPVQGFWDVYKSTAPSIATILRDNSYQTAYFGKWHCGLVNNQLPPAVSEHRKEYPDHTWVTRTPERHRAGFDDWFAFEVNNAPFKGFYYHQNEVNPRWLQGYQTDALTDMAIDYLQDYDREQPLFLVLSVEPPHFPLEAPERNLRLKPSDLKVPPTFIESEEARKKLAVYYAMIENLDENIGRLRSALNQLESFQDNTLLVYISDHGDFMGTRDFIGYKGHPHEESVRIPYIFHWPGKIPASGNNDELISLVDLVPTTLGLIGVPIPAHIQGCDMSASVEGKTLNPQESILLEMQGTPRWRLDNVDWRGLVTERWKYCFYETGHELLYDLQNDPYEISNLIEEMPEVCGFMRNKLLALLRESREPYFDVLLEYGTNQQRTLDVSAKAASGIGPYWNDGSIQRY